MGNITKTRDYVDVIDSLIGFMPTPREYELGCEEVLKHFNVHPICIEARAEKSGVNFTDIAERFYRREIEKEEYKLMKNLAKAWRRDYLKAIE